MAHVQPSCKMRSAGRGEITIRLSPSKTFRRGYEYPISPPHRAPSSRTKYVLFELQMCTQMCITGLYTDNLDCLVRADIARRTDRGALALGRCAAPFPLAEEGARGVHGPFAASEVARTRTDTCNEVACGSGTFGTGGGSYSEPPTSSTCCMNPRSTEEPTAGSSHCWLSMSFGLFWPPSLLLTATGVSWSLGDGTRS